MSFSEGRGEQSMELYNQQPESPEDSHDKGFYARLGVRADASDEVIKQAYKRQAREAHPDLNPDDPTSEERFKELGEAYESIADRQKREEYDRRNLDKALRTREYKKGEMSLLSIIKTLGIDYNKPRSEFSSKEIDTVRTVAGAMKETFNKALSDGKSLESVATEEEMTAFVKMVKIVEG